MSRVLPGIVLLVVSCLAMVTASGQEIPLADRLTGTWEGNGKLFGRDANFHMTWEWVLDHKFLRLTFRNGMKTPNGVQPVLEAQAFYKPLEKGHLEGMWFDTRGVVQLLEGDADATSLTVQWGSPKTEEGRTIYRILGKDRVEVEDLVLKEGEWNRFGEATYNRVKTDPDEFSKRIRAAMPGSDGTFDALGWLEGDWVRRTKLGEATESWKRVSDDTIEGVAFVGSGDSTRVTEYLRIERFGEEIFFIAKPSQNPFPTGFRLIESGEEGVVFENLNHDFPQRIIYTRTNEHALRVHIEATVDGEVRGVDFNFERRK